MSEKFKVGDKVMCPSIHREKIGKISQIYGYGAAVTGFRRSQGLMPMDSLIHAKPLSALWEDEKTCREIAELFFSKATNLSIKTPYYNKERDATMVNIGAATNNGHFFIFKDGGSIAFRESFTGGLTPVVVPFFKLTQLLTERGYYPVEE